LLFHGLVLHLGKSKLFKERSYQKVESCSQSALFFCLFFVRFSVMCLVWLIFFVVVSVWGGFVFDFDGGCFVLWAPCVVQTSFFLLICVWIWRRLLRAWFSHDLARVC
jgi:hypothetical protein